MFYPYSEFEVEIMLLDAQQDPQEDFSKECQKGSEIWCWLHNQILTLKRDVRSTFRVWSWNRVVSPTRFYKGNINGIKI